MDFLTHWGHIAGMAGMAAVVCLYLFRGAISKRCFPTLAPERSQGIVVLLMILVGAFGTFSLLFNYAHSGSGPPLVIHVHGPEGKQDIVLEDHGKLVIDFGSERKRQQIGAGGRTNCGEVPDEFIGKEVTIGLEAEGYVLIFPDSQYVMNGEPVYLAVAKDARLGMISGTVKTRDGSTGLDSARVVIGRNKAVTTNESGAFKIQLPERMRVEDGKTPYVLRVERQGYASQTKYYFPLSGEIEIRLEPKIPEP